MHAIRGYLNSRLQASEFASFKWCYMTQHLKTKASSRRQRVKMLVCIHLGNSWGHPHRQSSLDFTATQLLYTNCFCIASLSLTLDYNLPNTLKLGVCLILDSSPGWDDILPQNPSPNTTQHFFPPCKVVSTRKSRTWLGPELLITTPITSCNISIITVWYPWCPWSA